jgi:hypothetical protein
MQCVIVVMTVAVSLSNAPPTATPLSVMGPFLSEHADFLQVHTGLAGRSGPAAAGKRE